MEVVAYVPNLLDRSRIEPAVRRAGASLTLALDPSDLRPAGLVLVDLDRLPDLAIFAALGGTRTVGFASHVDTARLAAASAAGCRVVLARSVLFRRLERYGLGMTETSDRYERVAAGFAARLEGVGPDRWASPSPCTEWTARDVVTHVLGTHRTVVSRLTPDEEPVPVDADGDLVAQFGEARDAVAGALVDPQQAATIVGGMFGEQPFESLVGRLLCTDTLVHTWDLARATGQDDTLDPEAVLRAREFLEPIDEAIRRPGGFAAKIEPAPDADPQTAFLNFCGRLTGPAG